MTHNDVNIFALSKQDTSVMKGIAIIAMLCHHVYTCQPDWVEAYPYVLTMIGVLGKVCVAIFLFCSGYGLSVQYDKVLYATNTFLDTVRGTIRFLLKRFIKFYSAYWFIFLIFVPITVFFFDRPLAAAYGENVNIVKRLIFDILGIQGFQSYNITWWFNYLIILLYLFFPILFFAIRKAKWLGLIVSLLLMRMANKLGIFNYYDLLLWQFPFVLGIGWATYQDKLNSLSKYIRKYPIYFTVGVTALLCVGIAQRLYNIIPFGNITGVRFDGPLTVLILLTVIAVLRKCTYAYQVLNFLGKHSINIYMIHTFFNGYWTGFHKYMHTSEICRWWGINMWLLLMCCLLVSMLIEYTKEKICWNNVYYMVLH